MIAVVYAGVAGRWPPTPAPATWWPRPGGRARACCSACGGSGGLAQAAQWLFLTSLFAAALAFHNAVWRYVYALGRENVLPAALGRTGGNNIPKAASLAQSATGLAVIVVYAVAGQDPMTRLFFWLGTTGGFGILVLLALTAVAVVAVLRPGPARRERLAAADRPGAGRHGADRHRRAGRAALRHAARRAARQRAPRGCCPPATR